MSVRVLHVWHAYFFALTFWFIPVVHQDIINDTVEEADVLIAEGDEAVSEYETIRLSNIKRNSEFLLSLGLGGGGQEVGIRRGARVQQKRQKREEKSETVNKEEGARVQQKQLHSRVHMDKEEEADAIEQQQSQVQMYKVEIEQLHSQLNSYIQANFSLHP